jgi:GAF domain-containing protein
VLAVPMLRDGQVLGVIAVLRVRSGLHGGRDRLIETFADQALIAIENVRLFNETKEALEQQTATAEVLRVISSSVADAQPVFEKITQSCGALFAGPGRDQSRRCRRPDPSRALRRARRERFAASSVRAHRRADDAGDDRASRHALSERRRSGRSAGVRAASQARARSRCCSLRCCSTIAASARSSSRARRRARSCRARSPAQDLRRPAVIAIENAGLFNETQDALERRPHRRGAARHLRSVPNSSPVFEKILESCQRLFASRAGVLLVGEDGRCTRSPKRQRPGRLEQFFPRCRGCQRVGRGPRGQVNTQGRPCRRRRAARACAAASAERVVRRHLFAGHAPMLWVGEFESAPLRSSASGDRLPRRREIGLLRTFADQAVIAIQNARLFNETREALRKVELRTGELSEALDYQTAISDVLRVISQSPTDVSPVFDAILESASRLFGSPMSAVFRYDGRLVHLAATRNWPAAAIADASRFYPAAPNPQMLSGRVILSGTVQSEEDALTDPGYDRQAAGLGHWRRMIGAPLLRDGQPMGAIIVCWPEPGVTPARQADLLKTFADQGVIAIENVRLLSETTEALEQQTATAEVLQVISSSVADTAPVFDKILDSCERLFAASGLGIYLVDEEGMLRKAGFRSAREKPERALAGTFPRRLEGTATEIAIRERRVVHYGDVLAEPDVPAPLVRIAKAAGSFSIAFAPMLWEGRGVGAIQVSRDPPQPFSDKELTLLKTFADQAVIAIQNARLFNEIQAKSRELELANKHKSEFLANMSHELRTPLNAIIGFSEVLSEKMFGEVNDKQLEYLLDIHTSGHHLLSLINDILDLSKIEAGRMELDLATTNLPMLLDNCTTLVRERANRQGLVLALEWKTASATGSPTSGSSSRW